MNDRAEIYQRIKNARKNRYITNCYSMDLINQVKDFWESEYGFLFSYKDHGVFRLAYFAKDKDAINDLINKIDGGKYYLEYMTQDYDDMIPNDGIFVARMLRMTNPDCRNVFEADSKVLQFRNASCVEYAREEDAGEITRILWSVFRPEISHLLYEKELADLINKKQITVHRTDNRIVALLQADVMPRKFYINQVVNLGEQRDIHALLIERLEDYVSAGGKYLYSWVDDKNIASIKFHQKYRMEHDGMMSVIYCIER